MIGDNRDVFSRHAFDGRNVPLFLVITKGHGHAAGFCPARSANAMDVGLGLVRHFKVDDVGDGVDVNSTSSDITGDKDPDLAGFESVQSPLAGALGFVAMDCCGFNSRFAQELFQFVGVVFGAREDECPCHVFRVENVQQELFLVGPADMVNALLDLFAGGRYRCDFYGDWVVQDGVDEPLDFLWDRC